MATKSEIHYILSRIDVESWLNDMEIEFHYEGENIAPGWVGIDCPFCLDGDDKQHLGVNLMAKTISCWRCNTTGTIIKLMMKIKNISFQKAMYLLKKYIEEDGQTVDLRSIYDERETSRKRVDSISLDGTTEIPTDAHKNYLRRRRFNRHKIENEFSIRYGRPGSYWGYRIVIPIYTKKKIVTLLGRDITGQQSARYKALPKNKSILTPKECLYNLEKANETIVVVEGVTDVWRIGEGAIATFGTSYTDHQIQLIQRKKPKRCFVLYDLETEAQIQAERLATELSVILPDVQNVVLSEGDPGELSTEDVKAFRKFVFGKVY